MFVCQRLFMFVKCRRVSFEIEQIFSADVGFSHQLTRFKLQLFEQNWVFCSEIVRWESIIKHWTLNISNILKHWMEKCASVSVSPCEAVFAESMADLQNKLFQQSTSILSHLAMQTSVKNTQIHRYTNSQSQSDIFYLTWQCKYFSHILAISLCRNEMALAVYLCRIHAIPIQCIAMY